MDYTNRLGVLLYECRPLGSFQINSFIKDHWGIVTSLFLLLLSTLGLIYSWFYYEKFGINYLEHAEVSDLIGVLFVHPQFLFSIFSFLIGSVFLRFVIVSFDVDTNERKYKYSKEKVKRYFFQFLLMILLLIVVVTPYFVVTGKITDIKKSRLPIYAVNLGKNSELIRCAVSIGSTTNNLFYWDIVKKESIIIPKKNVTKIRVILPSPPELGYREQRHAPPGHLTDFDKRVIEWDKSIDKLCQ